MLCFLDDLPNLFPIENGQITISRFQYIEKLRFYPDTQCAGDEIQELRTVTHVDSNGFNPLFLKPRRTSTAGFLELKSVYHYSDIREFLDYQLVRKLSNCFRKIHTAPLAIETRFPRFLITYAVKKVSNAFVIIMSAKEITLFFTPHL